MKSVAYKLSTLLIACLIYVSSQGQEVHYLQWQPFDNLEKTQDSAASLGLAGPTAGIHNDALIIAGGANFPKPYWEHNKAWHDAIWVLENQGNNKNNWQLAGRLPHALAYSAVLSTDLGIISMGGSDGQKVFDEVLLLKWDQKTQTIQQEQLPKLPEACVYGSASMIGDVIYLAGGSSGLDLETAMNNLWRLDLSKYGKADFQWEVLPGWPGPSRAFNLTVAQHNGKIDCIYVFSGRRAGNQPGKLDVLKDGYEFDPAAYSEGKPAWRRIADLPDPRMAGTAIKIGQSHIFVLSGADGSLYQQADSLREAHPGFPKQILAYHTITNQWFEAGQMPANQVTSHAFPVGEDFILASGEIKPRVRSPQIWKLSPQRTASNFGWANLITIAIYLLLLVGIGIYFSFRTQSTDDFFRGGQRIPWWAAGCSIFATMLSSITFMAIPAKAYATDWVYFLLNMAIIALAPFIIHYILPYFRRINATSAYEYLEQRFNLATRLFASTSYILFQLGRMAIVMYLPALALAAVTPISIEMSILLMGLLSIIYCTLGGLEAVIWTDTLQTFVLLGGALFSLLLILFHQDVGANEFFRIATEANKFKMINWEWSYTEAALWVVIIGGLGQSLVPYSSDQGVVQRYMSVASEKEAARSIWTNAWLSLFATILFFGLGTALFVFYSKQPAALDPTFQTDAVFPLFIAHQLPAGIAGLVIAGVFAAAQSTISTSMNSIATAITTDFAKRFNLYNKEKSYLRLARILTVLFGVLGTGFALLIAYADIKSLWDSFIGILGLFGGAMCGLFMLGIFTKTANGRGALVGAFGGALCLWLVQQYTDVSVLMYATVGIVATVVIGWVVSWVWNED